MPQSPFTAHLQAVPLIAATKANSIREDAAEIVSLAMAGPLRDLGKTLNDLSSRIGRLIEAQQKEAELARQASERIEANRQRDERDAGSGYSGAPDPAEYFG